MKKEAPMAKAKPIRASDVPRVKYRPNKPAKRRGKLDPHAPNLGAEIKRVEMPGSHMFVVTDEDVKNAVPRQGCECAFALAKRRSLGTNAVRVSPLVSQALLPVTKEVLDHNRRLKRKYKDDRPLPKLGELAWHRMANSPTLERAVRGLDEHETFEAGVYHTHGFCDSHTLIGKRAQGDRDERYRGPSRKSVDTGRRKQLRTLKSLDEIAAEVMARQKGDEDE